MVEKFKAYERYLWFLENPASTMIRFLFPLFFFASIPVWLPSQNPSEGFVDYDEHIKTQLPTPGIITLKCRLFFNSTKSVYSYLYVENTRIMSVPESVYYRNFETGQRVDQITNAGTLKVEEGSIGYCDWQFTDETKSVLGYTCKGATMVGTVLNRPVVVKAWYTEDLPLPTGPRGFGQLPGTILEIDYNEGEQVVTATKITFRKVKRKELKAPKM